MPFQDAFMVGGFLFAMFACTWFLVWITLRTFWK